MMVVYNVIHDKAIGDIAKLMKYYNNLINGYIDEVEDLKKLIQVEETFGADSEKDRLNRLHKRLFECETLIKCFKINVKLLDNDKDIIGPCIDILNNNYNKMKEFDSYGFVDKKSR